MDSMERYLNMLLVLSTAIVLLLVYDRTDTMLTSFGVSIVEEEQSKSATATSAVTAVVSELSHKCSNVWKGHSENATKAHNGETAVDKWYSNYHNHPKYYAAASADTPGASGFCHRLPSDLSAAHLWNEHLHWILEASSSRGETMSSHWITSKLLQFLSPSSHLELGQRSPPATKAWGRLLQKINKRLETNDATSPMIEIAVFGGSGSANCNPAGRNAATTDMDCLWTVRLEAFLNTILNHGRASSEKRAIINITPMYHTPPKDVVTITTELDTAIIQNNLWNDYLQKIGGRSPDVIINAFTTQDSIPYEQQQQQQEKRDDDDDNNNNNNNDNKWKNPAAEDIDYYHLQRQIIQDFFRACLQLQPCSSNGNDDDNNTQDPPLLIALDDYVGNGSIMADNVQARVLQLLSDYYETAFISYAEVIRKLVYASSSSTNNQRHDDLLPLIHHHHFTTNNNNVASTTSATPNATQLLEHGLVGPIAMTLTLAYSFLKYTIDYCQEESSSKRDYAMVKEDVFHLVDNVMPPELNTDLCLNNVTQLWQEEKSKQEQKRQTVAKQQPQCSQNNNNQCSFSFWGGGSHNTQQKLDEYLQNYTAEGTMVGWKAGAGGRLLATQAGASLKLQLKADQQSKEHNKIRIFSVYDDSITATSNSTLQWRLSPQNKRRRRLLDEHQFQHGTGNHTTTIGVEQRRQQRRALQGTKTKSGYIQGTHNSPTGSGAVVQQTTIPVDSDLLSSSGVLELKLELVQGDTFEIVAIMFCSEQPN